MYYQGDSMETWQWLYVILITSTILPLMSAVVMEIQREGFPVHRMSAWLYVPAGLGILMLATPYGWFMLWALLIPFWDCAPLAPALFGTAFVAGTWILSFVGIFDIRRMWRTMTPKT